ncbi:hypothetical protein L5515_017108 [Caenorhabditis briggsae]|uniref:Uncharacterized protein n=1 Tax=Caenorhabditis briggsae TaxID=6238 RepID=A0AAE9FDA9_CAEBR|nr:hypothetical protein L5515_017108 [Caenorhabditis briggsae]
MCQQKERDSSKGENRKSTGHMTTGHPGGQRDLPTGSIICAFSPAPHNHYMFFFPSFRRRALGEWHFCRCLCIRSSSRLRLLCPGLRSSPKMDDMPKHVEK